MDSRKLAFIALAMMLAIGLGAFGLGSFTGYETGYRNGQKHAFEHSAEVAEYGYMGCISDDCAGGKEAAQWTRDTINRVAASELRYQELQGAPHP
jgi:hypothetical protein